MQYAPAFARDSDDHALGALIRAIATKDPVALSDLYARTAARLYALANRMLGCKEDAEEVVGDVLMYVWDHARQYDGERGCVLAWLTVITNTRAIDRLRKRIRHPSSHEAAQVLLTLAAESAGPEDVALKAQADGLLLREMALLPPLRQRLLHLSFFQEHTHTEIAHELCIPCGTVKSHVRRALITMRTSMTSAHA
jgi:RNA polymerase sigma-70 factor (ECF subfamily)